MKVGNKTEALHVHFEFFFFLSLIKVCQLFAAGSRTPALSFTMLSPRGRKYTHVGTKACRRITGTEISREKSPAGEQRNPEIREKRTEFPFTFACMCLCYPRRWINAVKPQAWHVIFHVVLIFHFRVKTAEIAVLWRLRIVDVVHAHSVLFVRPSSIWNCLPSLYKQPFSEASKWVITLSLGFAQHQIG